MNPEYYQIPNWNVDLDQRQFGRPFFGRPFFGRPFFGGFLGGLATTALLGPALYGGYPYGYGYGYGYPGYYW
ncbi:hypothetical protein [Heyndrickxia oleronia]|jgi:hypothetical protein|uniref:hypothetical protein n=1 Tax=Heyndrickxia oleronia TaxID=38875 RepID=UPI00243008E0|nr:hypothetical protein [Heyndrickxia oleronia]MCI1590047.1 hypothetical protein [Heyndrickxia oleronia]MCI1613738.1 hypothetical protein [Heyndrickxia oleronia]MCI1744868.1 hypothetical protein [Heyndrickxia oleronia]MCI1761745.1 hypothetical protein [Heyndrickxia oleronia]